MLDEKNKTLTVFTSCNSLRKKKKKIPPAQIPSAAREHKTFNFFFYILLWESMVRFQIQDISQHNVFFFWVICNEIQEANHDLWLWFHGFHSFDCFFSSNTGWYENQFETICSSYFDWPIDLAISCIFFFCKNIVKSFF